MARPRYGNAVRWLIGLLTPLAIIPFFIFTLFCIWVFESGLLPEQELKATTVGTGIKARVEYAVEVGIPFNDLRAMTDFLDDTRAASQQISFIAVATTNGRILYQSSNPPNDLRLLVNDAIAVKETGETSALDEGASWASRVVNRTLRLFGFSDQIVQRDLSSPRIGDYYVTILPLMDGNTQLGHLAVGVGVTVLSRVVGDLIFDTATVVLAAFVIAVELMILVVTLHLIRPIKLLAVVAERLRNRDLSALVQIDSFGAVARTVDLLNVYATYAFERLKAVYVGMQSLPAGRRRREARLYLRDLLLRYELPNRGVQDGLQLPALTYIRLPLFLFFLAEALVRPLLPVLINGLDSSVLPLSKEFALGLPFAAFMAASIFGVVFGSFAADRMGPRSVLVFGALFSAAGLGLHATATNIEIMTVFRCASGLGYGLVYAAAQVYVVENSERRQRASGFSVFLAAVVAAEICGPAIGGIIADRIGFAVTFVVGAGLLLLSLLFVLFLISHRPDIEEKIKSAAPRRLSYSEYREGGRDMMMNARFMVLCILYAVPSKLILTGAVFFLIPLAAEQFGANVAETGRILMLYGIMIVLTGPLFARFADKYHSFGLNIALGGVLSGIGLVTVVFLPGIASLAIAVAFIGLGQAMSIPSQLTYALEVAEAEAEKHGAGMVLGIFRFVERVGSLLGPVLGAVLIGIAGITEALMIFGIYAIVSACLASAFFLTFGPKDENRAIEELLTGKPASQNA
ncbi:MAG: MFS transporter [Hyphomicrobiales bacterium]|nr:MFS transporter [Hyphomicrobiales bacterium]